MSVPSTGDGGGVGHVWNEGGDDGRLDEIEKLSSTMGGEVDGEVHPLEDCKSQSSMGFACGIHRVNTKCFNFSSA